jgi:hypothetical protein
MKELMGLRDYTDYSNCLLSDNTKVDPEDIEELETKFFLLLTHI